MIRRALFALLVILASSAAALSDEFFEIDQFDVTGQLPPGFGAGTPSQHSDSITFDSLDGQAQLTVFGGLDMLGGLHNTREISRQGLLFADSSIIRKSSDEGLFSFAGVRSDGRNYYYYRRLGVTCEGSPAFGNFVLAYDPEAARIFEPMIEGLIASLHIGACG